MSDSYTFFESSLFAFILYSLGKSEFKDYNKLAFPAFGQWKYDGKYSWIVIEREYDKIMEELF